MSVVCRRSLLISPNLLRLSRCHLNTKNPLKPINKYVFSSYFKFITNYGFQIETKFPAAMRIYRIFKDGFRDFYNDMKMYIAIKRKLNSNNKDLRCLSLKELELNLKMPKDIYKVSPVLLISALPFANYIVFPIAYFFPRQLLSRQFWTLQQKTTFAVSDQKKRLKYYKPVFRSLQAKIENLKGHLLYDKWRQCVAQLGSGLHPSSKNIALCRPLFGSGEVYDIQCLTASHIKALLKMHGMHTGIRRRRRLIERSSIIYFMDVAIVRQGGVETLTHEEVRSACFIRGLNPTNMNSEETVRWLKEWVALSTNMGDENSAFILHLPILTAYNHPSNWVLIH